MRERGKEGGKERQTDTERERAEGSSRIPVQAGVRWV